jgi:hypothetical protein
MSLYETQLENRIEELEKQVQDVLYDRDRYYHQITSSIKLKFELDINCITHEPTGIITSLLIDNDVKAKTLGEFDKSRNLDNEDLVFFTLKEAFSRHGFSFQHELKGYGIERVGFFKLDHSNETLDEAGGWSQTLSKILSRKFLTEMTQTTVYFTYPIKDKPGRWYYFKRFIRGY